MKEKIKALEKIVDDGIKRKMIMKGIKK